MLRPSRPMMRPFMSSAGSWTTETVVSAAWPAASRCMTTREDVAHAALGVALGLLLDLRARAAPSRGGPGPRAPCSRSALACDADMPDARSSARTVLLAQRRRSPTRVRPSGARARRPPAGVSRGPPRARASRSSTRAASPVARCGALRSVSACGAGGRVWRLAGRQRRAAGARACQHAWPRSPGQPRGPRPRRPPRSRFPLRSSPLRRRPKAAARVLVTVLGTRQADPCPARAGTSRKAAARPPRQMAAVMRCWVGVAGRARPDRGA